MHARIDALMRPRFWSLLPSTILDWVVIFVSVFPSIDTPKRTDTSREHYLEYFTRRLHRTDLLLVGAREHYSGCTSLHLRKRITTGATHCPPAWHTSHICSIWAAFLQFFTYTHLLTRRVWSCVMLTRGRNVTVHSYVVFTRCDITL